MIITLHRIIKKPSRTATSIIATVALLCGIVAAPLQSASAAATFAAPVKVRAYTGGNSIALLWNPATGTTPKKYEIYRNGTKIASPVAQTNNNMSTTTQRYYDKAVTKGVAYKYQVKAISPTGVASAKTTAITVTHPKAPTPVPTIAIDPAMPAEFTAWATKGKTELQHWYPKFNSLLASGGYAAPTAMTITTRAGDVPLAWADGTTIYVSENYLRQNLTTADPIGVLMHEATHVLQQYDDSSIPASVQEGLADWTRKAIYNDVDLTAPAKTSLYDEGYAVSAYFFQWIMKQYSVPTLVKKINVAAYKKTYSNDIYVQLTGKTIGQLWTQMTGAKVGSPGLLRNAAADTCAYIPNYDAVVGKKLESHYCWGIKAQQWTFVHSTNTSKTGMLRGLTKCIGSYGFGDSSYVQLADCSNSTAVTWTPQADGTLKNQNTGRCLQPEGDSTAYGVILTVKACAGTSIQKWSKLPV